ncbi:MAG TPA: phage terminase large subunit [Bryobacteraceae bacterium]|nr:phage terminase large subunit [Bryobacteraceae bacterium]
MSLSKAQGEVYKAKKRFRVLVAGRRFGKTHLALVELIHTAWNNPASTCWYIAPSYRQAKRIAWDRLKSMIGGAGIAQALESELTIRLANGSAISLRGADQYDSLRGNGLDFVVLDEFAQMSPEVWTEVIRPALADRKGRALFIGTPQGHDHLYDRFQFAQSQSLAGASTPESREELAGGGSAVAGPSNADWAAFRYRTLDGGNVTEEELASAARELDDRLFRQEFEASFETTSVGLAYHAFSRESNVRRCEYRPGTKLIWSLDFNVHPMCSVIAQQSDNEVEVLDELVIDNANTSQMCDRFWERTRAFRNPRLGAMQVDIYGDASGYARRSCGSYTDWQLIRNFFSQHVGQAAAHIKAANANPAVRDRVNLVNGRFLNSAGERRLFVDPKCKELILDLERICWRLDDAGQPTCDLDKSDRMRTHLSDALGYYLAQAFPLTPKNGERRNPLLF